MERVLALLYDIHGNLPALEAVLDDAGRRRRVPARRRLRHGGAWPRETVERLRELDNATWIRGNADRWLAERHDAPAPIDEIAARTAELLGDELVAELPSFPSSPRSATRSTATPRRAPTCRASAPSRARSTRSCSTASTAKRVVFGHTHVQFTREGPSGIELLNPGSVGMPWDGDHRAAYAVIDGDRVELPPRRVRLGGVGGRGARARRRAARRAAWSWPGSTWS